MSIFDKFNQKMDKASLNKQIADAEKNQPKQLEDGNYDCVLDVLEVKTDKDVFMVHCQFKVIEGECKGSLIHRSFKCSGTKNDGFMIWSASKFINQLQPSEELVWHSDYERYNNDILDIAEELCGKVGCDVEVKTNTKNPKYKDISIGEVWDI